MQPQGWSGGGRREWERQKEKRWGEERRGKVSEAKQVKEGEEYRKVEGRGGREEGKVQQGTEVSARLPRKN